MSDHRVTSLIVEGPGQSTPIEFRTHAWVPSDSKPANSLSVSTKDQSFSTHIMFTASQARALAADMLAFAENIEATEREASQEGGAP
jgi:hypothetical protein